MPEPAPRACTRCGEPLTAGVPIKPASGTLCGCPGCGLLYVVKEMGEMGWRDDRADPTDWGTLGWA